MCFGAAPKAPAAPPPPPPAPPMLEQESPQLSEAMEDNEALQSKTQGLSEYKVSRRDNYFSGNNPLTIRPPSSGN